MSVNLVAMRSVFTTAILCVACFFSAKPVTAAPFCIETQGTPSECWYYDVRSCREEAKKKQGRCAVNLNAIKVSGKGAPYCIIDSAMKPWCTFQNEASCETEAARSSAAICFQNAAHQDNDPYRFDRMHVWPK